MKITLEPTEEPEIFSTKHPAVTIKNDDDHLNIEDMLEDIIKPALIAWGFPNKCVKKIKYKGK